ncbi:hypothetical protein [Mesorhizobium australicum]
MEQAFIRIARHEDQGQPDLGKGPGISQGPSTNQVVFDLLKGR